MMQEKAKALRRLKEAKAYALATGYVDEKDRKAKERYTRPVYYLEKGKKDEKTEK